MFARRPFAALALAAALSHPAGAADPDFEQARQDLMRHAGCAAPRMLPAGINHGDMAHCVRGAGGTLIWEVEKAREGPTVQRVRLTWFDFVLDDPAAAGIPANHADRTEARRLLAAFVERYAPRHGAELADAFFGDQDLRLPGALGAYEVQVEHFRNPSLIERRIEALAKP
jgi:hypothetical protein